MKILFISNIFPPHARGGNELGCADIARALQKIGHQVEIATSLPCGYLNRTAPVDDLTIAPIFQPVFVYEEALRAWRRGDPASEKQRCTALGGGIVGNMMSLYQHLERTNPDLVWIFNPLGLGPIGIGEVCALSAKRCLMHFMDDVDGVIAQHQQHEWLLGRWKRVKSLVNAISCTQFIQKRNSNCGPFRHHRVIFNGVSFPEGRRGSQPPPVRNGAVRLVYFGQVERHKGLLQVVRGVAHLRNLHPDLQVEIDIIGQGEVAFREELLNAIGQAGLTSTFRVLGFVEKNRLLDSLSSYDAGILLLDLNEPFAYTPAEAASAGLPVIITRIPVLQEIQLTDYPLFVADRDNSAEVAAQILFAVNHRDRLPDIGRQLNRELKVHLSFDNVILPAYLRAIHACPLRLNAGPSLSDLVAPYATSAFHANVVA